MRYRSFPSGFFWNPWVSAGSHRARSSSPRDSSRRSSPCPRLLLPEAGIETGHSLSQVQLRISRGLRLPAEPALLGPRGGRGSRGLGLRDRADGVGTLDAELRVGHVSPAPDGGRPRVRGGAHGPRPAIRDALDPPVPRRRLSALDPLRSLAAGALPAGARGLAARAGTPSGALGRLGASTAVAVAILVPSILATARFLEASEYGALRRGMGGSYPLPLRQLRLYFVPDYAGTPRRDDYTRRRLDPGRQLHRDGRGRRPGRGRPWPSWGWLRRGAGPRRLFAILLGAAVAIPLYAGGALLSAVGSLPLLEISLFARAKILILLAVGILAACGTSEALEAPRAEPRLRVDVVMAPARPASGAVSGGGPAGVSGSRLLPGAPSRRCRLRRHAGNPAASRADLRRLALRGGRLDAASQRRRGPRPRGRPGPLPAGRAIPPAPRRRRPELLRHLRHVSRLRSLSLDPVGAGLDLGRACAISRRRRRVSRAGRPRDRGARRRAVSIRRERSPRTRARRRRKARLPARVRGAGPRPVFERPSALPRFRLEGAGLVRTLELRPERFAVETETDEPARLATSQKTFAPYWKVFLDGEDVDAGSLGRPLLRARGAGRPPPGRGTVPRAAPPSSRSRRSGSSRSPRL